MVSLMSMNVKVVTTGSFSYHTSTLHLCTYKISLISKKMTTMHGVRDPNGCSGCFPLLPKMSQQCKKSDGMSVKTYSSFVHRELSFSLVAMTMTMEAATDDSVFHKSQNYKQIFNCKKWALFFSIDCYFWQTRGEVGIRYSTAKNGSHFSQLVVIFGKRKDKWELFYISGISAIDFLSVVNIC